MEKAQFDISAPASWGSFFERLFVNDFMPHGHCFFWRPDILWLHVVSDALISLAYYAIPLILFYFVLKRKELPFSRIFILFGAFILLCGTTHIFAVIAMWHPVYRLEGLVKLLTAIVSLGTAFALIPMVPNVLKFPHQEKTIQALSEKTRKLAEVNSELARFNRLAIGREKRIIELKHEVNKLSQELKRPMPYELSFEKKSSA